MRDFQKRLFDCLLARIVAQDRWKSCFRSSASATTFVDMARQSLPLSAVFS